MDYEIETQKKLLEEEILELKKKKTFLENTKKKKNFLENTEKKKKKIF